MKVFYKILFTLLTVVSISNCLRVHKAIQPVTFVTPKSNSTTSSGASRINYKYYDNLQSPSTNYYYGSITKDAYDMHIKQYQLQNYQSCFGQLPYATTDAQSCMNCPKQKPLFNLGTRECQICKLNITQKCNTILNQQTALANTQPAFVNTSNTANVSKPTNVSNTSSNSQTGNQSNNNNASSIGKTNQTSSPTQNNSSISNKTGSNNIVPTSSNTSYPYVFEWQPKPKPQINTTNSSNSSQQNLNYIQAVPLGDNNSSGNQINSQNITFPNYTVINETDSSKNVSNETVLIAENSNPQTKFPSNQCLSMTPLYNSTTKKCQACPTGTQYIYSLNKCLNYIYATDPRSNNIILNSSDQIINKNYQIQKKNPTRTIKYCPSTTPYQINGTCNQCINGSLYNATSEKCQNSCPDGQVYNQITSNCVNGTYITNPSALSLLSPLKNYQNFKKQQQNLLQSSFIYVRCPLNNPISVNNKCTQCDRSTPYYNIDSKKCEDCSRGRYYDGVARICKGEYDQGLQVYRMVPNII